MTQPSEAADVTQPTEAAEVTQPMEVTEVTQPMEAAEVTQPMEVAEVTQPMEAAEVTQPMEAAEATQPSEVAEVTHPTEVMEATQLTEVVELTQTAQTAQTAQTMRATAAQTVVHANIDNSTAMSTTDAETVHPLSLQPADGRCGDFPENNALQSDEALIAQAVSDESAAPSGQVRFLWVDRFADDNEMLSPESVALNRTIKLAALKENLASFRDIADRLRRANTKYLEIVAKDAYPKSRPMAIDIPPINKAKFAFKRPKDNPCRIDGKTTACRTGRNEQPIEDICNANKHHNYRREMQLYRAEYELQQNRADRLFPSKVALATGSSVAATASDEDVVSRTSDSKHFLDSGISSGDETNHSEMSDGE